MLGSRGRRWFGGRGAWTLVTALVLAGPAGRRARAAEVTRVVSALDDDNRFDFNVTAAFAARVEDRLHQARVAVTRQRASRQQVTSSTGRRATS